MKSGGIRRRRRVWRPGVIAGVLVAGGLFGLLGPDLKPAQAAGLCQGRKVRSLPFATGQLRVYRSGDGYVCAVAVAKDPGVRRTMTLSVQARGSAPVVDKGIFKYHAGPVTVHAGRRCISVSAQVGGKKVSSGWILC